MGMRVEKSSLGPLTPLAKGGLGEVYRVSGFHLPGDPADLAYKEFTSHVAEQAKAARTAVAFRAGLSPAGQADLDSHAAWPRALVEQPRGTVIGLLMPLIPADFFCPMEDPDTGRVQDKPLEMSWLAASAQQRAAARLALREVSKLERLILLGQLIWAIGRLHKLGWVFGDLSLRNAVFALDPPRVLLLDCDGAAPLSDPARQQANTPWWFPPEITNGAQHLQDDRTDVYKLGLAILRCMTPGKGAATAMNPAGVAGALDPEGENLITRVLGPDRGQRPPARELYDYFYRLVSALVLPPEVTMARLRHPFRVRGQDVRIDWQISNARMVTVLAGQQRLAVDLGQQPDGCAFRPDESGPVAIEVGNRFGTIRKELGDVTLYDLPPFQVDFDFLPTPQVPRLPELPVTALDRVVATAPAARLPDIPAVPAPDSFGLVQSLMHSATLPVPLPQFGAAVADASAALSAALQAQATQVGASVRTAYLASQGSASQAQGGNEP
jgi:hypothetical protein